MSELKNKETFLNSLSRPAWLEIDAGILRDNFRNIKAMLGSGVDIMAIIKMDAYGHGFCETVQALRDAGCRFFGVGSAEEASLLREHDKDCDILVLGAPQSKDIAGIIAMGAGIFVSSIEQARRLSESAENAGCAAKVHIKVDTGMGRFGVRYERFTEFFEKFSKLNGLIVEGVCTHFSASDDREDGFSEVQLERFLAVLSQLKSKGVAVKHIHASNSASVLRNPAMHFSLIRPGLMLYGINPFSNEMEVPVTPVMQLKSRVSYTKKIPAGASVSYGRKFIAEKDTVIGIIPVGYGDGYPRLLSNKTRVLIKGKSYPVIGAICMDYMIADLGPDAQVSEFDEVTLIGCDGSESITVTELAGLIGTIPYEIMTCVGKSLPRFYRGADSADLTTSTSLVYNSQTLNEQIIDGANRKLKSS